MEAADAAVSRSVCRDVAGTIVATVVETLLFGRVFSVLVSPRCFSMQKWRLRVKHIGVPTSVPTIGPTASLHHPYSALTNAPRSRELGNSQPFPLSIVASRITTHTQLFASNYRRPEGVSKSVAAHMPSLKFWGGQGSGWMAGEQWSCGQGARAWRLPLLLFRGAFVGTL